MQYIPSSTPTVKGPAAWFTGDVYIDSIKDPDKQSPVGCAHVRFTPRAHTAWHTHPKGQTLYVTDGIGVCLSPRRQTAADSAWRQRVYRTQ